MKYKVGDKVRVRSDLINDKFYGCLIWMGESMGCLAGKVLTIKKTIETSKGDVYDFEETPFHLSIEMLESNEVESCESNEVEDDVIHKPKHYNQHKHECIEEMIAVFGIDDVKTFCKLNVWKYRYRSDAKDGKKDLKKADRYMDILMELNNEGKV